MVVVDDSCLKQADSLAHSPNQVAWSECRRPLPLLYIHQMNRVNSRNDLVVMMTAP